MISQQIQLLLSDVDGTLVTNQKTLTEDAVKAIRRVSDAGIRFAITSGRPPRGLSMFLESLSIDTPIATLNGAIIVDSYLRVLEKRNVPSGLLNPIVETLNSSGIDYWMYRAEDWLVRSPTAPHIAKESATVQFSPTVVSDFSEVLDTGGVAKIVGVSDDLEVLSDVESKIRSRFGRQLSITRSQPYYIDLSHPDAEKGRFVVYLAERYNISTSAIATIGDMPTDMSMFARSGLSIAMGNASIEVQRAADEVTTSNDDEGFATAVDRFILPSGAQTRGW